MTRVFFLLTFFFITQQSIANRAEPIKKHISGDLISEPFIKRFAIVEKENLIIDLTPLIDNSEAVIKATYLTKFDKSVENFELLFIANQLRGNEFKIFIDKKPVEGKVVDSLQFPSGLNFPVYTPSFNTFEALPFQATAKSGFLFMADITEGEHEITVEYIAAPPAYSSSNSLTKIWQLGYLLSPARDWKLFKELNLEIILPENWDMTTNIPVKKIGDSWQGQYKGIPADFISISLKASSQTAVILNIAICTFIVLLTFYSSYKALGTLARLRFNKKINFLLSYLLIIIISIAATIVFTALIFTEPSILNWLLNDQLDWNYGTSRPYFIFAIPVMWVFLLVLLFLFYFINLKYWNRAMKK